MFFVPAALSNLRERFPKLEVRLVSYEPEAALPKLKSRELDLVIAEEYPGHGLGADPLLERDLLIEDRLQICVPKSLPRSANLTALPWAVEPLGGIARAWTTTLWSELAIAPTIGFESADIIVHKQLVSSGLAIAVLPSLVLQKEQSGLRVWSRDFLAAREICVVRRSSSAGNPALAHIIDELRNCAQQASGKL
jgi:DNA-binding transcriptional LysR family regulator